VGYTYQQDGHTFYVLNFTGADTTWVYDAATGAWHERAGFAVGDFTRHRGNNHARFNGDPHVGDYQNGKIYTFSLDVYADDGAVQKWLRSWRALPTGANNLKRTTHHSLQIDCETGVGLNGVDPFDPPTLIATQSDVPINTETGGNYISGAMGTESSEDIDTEASDTLGVTEDEGLSLAIESTPVVGANPQLMMRWSDDGGHTYSEPRQTSMGRIGRTGTRAIFRRLGMTTRLRDRVYEISGTDPVKIAINGAELHVSETAY
jgi:hypothetical protein